MGQSTSKDISNLNNNSDLQKLGAHGGSIYLGILANTGLAVTSIYVREDATTITVCTGVNAAGATYNFLTTGFAISGISLLKGDLFIAPSGYRITAITVTAGSLIVYQ